MKFGWLAIGFMFISVPSYEREVDKYKVISETIKHYSKNVPAKKIAKAVYGTSRKYNLDWRVMLAILQQESSFQTDPQGCLLKSKKCIDFGIGQINWKTWKDVFHLNKHQLLTNINYNIDIMGRILFLVKQGNEKDPYYYTRYHSFKPSHRKIYQKLVAPKYKKIKMYAQSTYYKE